MGNYLPFFGNGLHNLFAPEGYLKRKEEKFETGIRSNRSEALPAISVQESQKQSRKHERGGGYRKPGPFSRFPNFVLS
jgi:hypothetical protein